MKKGINLQAIIVFSMAVLMIATVVTMVVTH